jgi:hypothetical protein
MPGEFQHFNPMKDRGTAPTSDGESRNVSGVGFEVRIAHILQIRLALRSNPNRPSQDSLGIAYAEGDDTKIVRPDFIFFTEQDGKIVADITDPHGFNLADALP